MLNLTVRNWCCWDHQAFELGPCSFVVGRNGSGKTSLRDALEFVLIGTGQLRGYGTKQELADFAIRDDLEDCEVIFQTDALRLRRTMDRHGQQELFRSVHHGATGWTDEEKLSLKRDQGNPFGNAPDDLVRCMLEPTHFYQLEPLRRQEVLVQATSDDKLEEGVVLAALMRRLEYQDAEDLTALESAATWVHEDGFRTAEDAAIEQRQQAKRDLGNLVVGEPPERLADTPGEGLQLHPGRLDLMSHPVADVEAVLKSLRADHLVAVKMEAAGTGALQGKLVEAEAAHKRHLDAVLPPVASKYRASESQKSLTFLEGRERPSPGTWDESLLENTTTRSRLAGEAHNLAVASTREATGAIAVMEARLETPASFPRPAECPKGPPGMRCPVKPSVWAPAVTKTLGDRIKLEGELDRLRAEWLDLGMVEDEAKTEMEKWDRRAAELVRQSEHHEAMVEDLREYDAELAAARERLANHSRSVAEDEGAQANAYKTLLDNLTRRVAEAQLAVDASRAGDEPTGATAEELAAAVGAQERLLEVARDFWREQHGWEERTAEAAVRERSVVRWDRIC